MANPSYTRLDTWNLFPMTRVVTHGGRPRRLDTTRRRGSGELMDRIGAYERYWLYPGHRIWRLSALI